MKKLLIWILAVLMMFSLTACNLGGLMGARDGEEVALNYDYEKMEENLTKLKEDKGLLIEMTVVSTETGEKPESESITYAENANAFYYSGDGTEIMFDFSDETKCVTYEKQADGTWTKYDTVYADSGITREQMEESASLYTVALTGYLGNYSQFAGQMMKVTSDKVAGRDCDKFTYSMMFMGFGVEYNFSVDKETGMCLKWEMSAAAGMEGSASVEYTCTKFETPYEIKFPTEYIEADDGDEGNEGGENNGDNGEVNDGNGNTDNENENIDGTEGKVSVYGNGEILIADAYTSFNRSHGYGKLSIEFVYSNGEEVKFDEIWEMSATEWGFSTTDPVCTLTVVTVSAEQNVITIQYEGITEEEFTFGTKDLTDIIYTPVAEKEIKTAQGEVIEGFTLNDF